MQFVDLSSETSELWCCIDERKWRWRRKETERYPRSIDTLTITEEPHLTRSSGTEAVAQSTVTAGQGSGTPAAAAWMDWTLRESWLGSDCLPCRWSSRLVGRKPSQDCTRDNDELETDEMEGWHLPPKDTDRLSPLISQRICGPWQLVDDKDYKDCRSLKDGD